MMQEATILNLWRREEELAEHIRAAEKNVSAAMGMTVKLRPYAFENHAAIAAICNLTARVLDVPYDTIISDSRKRNHVEARQIAIYMVRKHLPKIGPETIASYFDKTNGMVYGAVKVIETLIDGNNPVILQKVSICERAFFKEINNKP